MGDVVIIGAGPAGLTLGSYLAVAGVRTLIFDKANHPRPHVGESLMPSTVRVLREIGFHPLIEAADFPRSGGIVYHPASAPPVEVAYAEFPQEGVGQSHTYHVDRSKFDMLLLKHAEELGCRIVEGAGVREVLFDDSGAAQGVRVAIGDHLTDIPARIVVDAGGRATHIGRQRGLREDHPDRTQFGLHAWFVDVDRGKRATELFTHVYFLPELGGWAWHAPINANITSIGLVADRAVYKASGLDVEGFFHAGLAHNRALHKATGRSRRVNQIKGEANYAYALREICGDGWLAVGDAALFLDPIFSSGVAVAMHSARFASERIRSALEGDDVRRATFLPYELRLQQDAATWDELVSLFYRSPSTFTRFLESEAHRPALLRTLQGDVEASSARALLRTLREAVDTLDQREDNAVPASGQPMAPKADP